MVGVLAREVMKCMYDRVIDHIQFWELHLVWLKTTLSICVSLYDQICHIAAEFCIASMWDCENDA